MNTVKVFVETGKKKVFAGAIDWPGWARGGKDERAALQALTDYGPRYEQVLRGQHLDFYSPAGVETLRITERNPGNSTTNFGRVSLKIQGVWGCLEKLDRFADGS